QFKPSREEEMIDTTPTSRLTARMLASGRPMFLCFVCANYEEGQPHPLCQSADCECLCTRPATPAEGAERCKAAVQATEDPFALTFDELEIAPNSAIAAMIRLHPKPGRLVEAIKRFKTAGDPPPPPPLPRNAIYW